MRTGIQTVSTLSIQCYDFTQFPVYVNDVEQTCNSFSVYVFILLLGLLVSNQDMNDLFWYILPQGSQQILSKNARFLSLAHLNWLSFCVVWCLTIQFT